MDYDTWKTTDPRDNEPEPPEEMICQKCKELAQTYGGLCGACLEDSHHCPSCRFLDEPCETCESCGGTGLLPGHTSLDDHDECVICKAMLSDPGPDPTNWPPERDWDAVRKERIENPRDYYPRWKS